MSDTSKAKELRLAEEKAAKTADEIRAYADEDGVDLSLEDLERVSGGFASAGEVDTCENCGSRDLEWTIDYGARYAYLRHCYVCRNCGYFTNC